MSNEMVPVIQDLPVAKYADDKSFAVVASSSNFLPRVQLYGGNTEAAKEGKIPLGNWGFVRSGSKEIEDLTKQFDCLVIGWRPKSMEISKKDGNILSFFNPEHKEFKRIQLASDIKDSGCMFGPEFLIWVALNSSFATLFMNNKTMRRAAPELKALMGGRATLKTQLIKAKGYSWHGPVITTCSTPFPAPTTEAIMEEVAKFNNPPETDVEKAPEDDRAR